MIFRNMGSWIKDNPKHALLYAVVGVLLLVLVIQRLSSGQEHSEMTTPMAKAWESIQDAPEDDRPAALRRWVDSQTDSLAVPALQSLIDAIGDESLPYLKALLANNEQPGARNAEIRRVTINLIGEVGDRTDDADITPILQTLINDKDDEVRAQAARQLGSWHIWEAMPHLVAAMRDSESVKLREQSYRAVKRIIGTDYRYVASAPLHKREPIVERLEKDWRGYEGAHRDYVERKYGVQS